MRIFKTILFGLGLLLLLINLFGLVKSMRHPDLYTEENTGRLNDVTITLEDAKKELLRQENETDKDFALRVNDIVSKSMSHYFKNEGKKKYNLRVPLRENYILFLANSFKEDNRYEFKNYKKGLERGVGLCSSHSIVVKGVLLDNGIEAHLWDIAGHVVVRARVSENEWFILDPDYGLYVPYDIDAIEADPEITRASYADMADLYKPEYDDPYTTDKVVELYGKEGNHIYTYDASFEKFSYIAIWLLPLLFMAPLIFGRTRQKRKTSVYVSILLVASIFFMPACKPSQSKLNSYDIVIYGGTSAGVTAAIQSSRMGKTVVLIEPSNRLGGLSTGGLGQTDIGNKQAIGGISREFYQNIALYYSNAEHWSWQERSEYVDGGQTRTEEEEDAMWTFEPSAAVSVYQEMLEIENIVIRFGQRLDRESGVEKLDASIISIAMESGEVYRGKVFIDASYEGDLLAAAGVSYTIGREGNKIYGENLNGVQANDTSRTLTGELSHNGWNHNFVDGVDPYIVEGDRSSGLLPYINASAPAEPGSGDQKVQAYCFRMCLTDHPENRIPFAKPDKYNALNYELLFRNYEAGYARIPWINSQMPNRKTDTNNRDGFSTDFIGQNYDYAEASYREREHIVELHRNYQQGLMWSLAKHPRIPEEIRSEVSRWGTCKDEFEREDGWQQQLYIREARRMISDLVMTQRHCEGIEVVKDAVGMAAYGMDSHHIQRYINENGWVKNEGNVEARVKGPYPIGYRSIIPKKSECSNLIVPVCLSASHIGFGSIRMEPVFMVLGQSAATAASMAIDENVPVQELEYKKLREQLIRDGQRL